MLSSLGHPPPIALTRELRWVLLRAFGPPESGFPGPVDAVRAARLATDLGVVERIGARVRSHLLVAELGREVACQLAAARLQVLAGVERLCDLLPELASAGEASAIPIVLLKFAALYAGGHLAQGSRAAGDLDVLVREGDAERATAVLIGLGFGVAETTMADHHLPPLQDGRGRVVELHTRVPGLRRPGNPRFASFEALEAAGALEPARGLGRGCHVLRRDAMVAHLVAHGLAHHGGADEYPVTRMLADVIDLLPDGCRRTGSGAREWIADDVTPTDLEAVLGLCDALRKGDLEGIVNGGEASREGALLRHVVAGGLDPEYRSALRVSHLLRPLTDEPRWRKFLKMVRYTAFPSDAQLAARLGLPSARLIDRRLRMEHAGDLARRLPHLARAALRFAWRGVLRRTAHSSCGVGEAGIGPDERARR